MRPPHLLLLLLGSLLLAACSRLPLPPPTGQYTTPSAPPTASSSSPLAPPPQSSARSTTVVAAPSPTPPRPVLVKPLTSPPASPPPPTLPAQSPHYATHTASGITLHLLTYDARRHTLHVADQTPGARWTSARQACQALGGLAAINGGFFTAEGLPLGLVRAGAQSAGTWNAASSLASGVYQSHQGSAQLLRNRSARRDATHLLQTGPFLLERGQVVGGLSDRRSAQRSVLLWDGAHHWALVQTSSCTLADLAPALRALPAHLPRHSALNLDGGRSCDLYIAPSIAPVQKAHWLKSQVRNYLVLVPNQ